MVFRPVRPVRLAARPMTMKPDPDGPSFAPSPSPLNGPMVGPSRPAVIRPRRPFQRGPIVMTASGPFSQGSASTEVRNAGRSRGIPFSAPVVGSSTKLEPGIKSESSHRYDYREPDKADRKEREEYSDPEEDGVEIIDMEEVSRLDSMAPTFIPRMKGKEKKKKKTEKATKVKAEIPAIREDRMVVEDADIELEEEEKEEIVENADALDLSASEDEEIMDDLLGDFIGDEDGTNPENRLYLFQFPPLFPEFKASKSAQKVVKKRSVAFAEDTVGGGGAAGASPNSSTEDKVKSEAGEETSTSKVLEKGRSNHPEGQIGRLDVYRDGRVNFRFNDIVMELTGGSQSSFLQQVMILDGEQHKATTLGELHRKFVVSPEIESMLNDVDSPEEAVELTESDD